MATGIEQPTSLRVIEPEDFLSLAEELQKLGAKEVIWGGARVVFADRPVAPAVVVQDRPKLREEKTDMYHDPRLWGGEKAPVFPGSSNEVKS